MRLSEAQAKLRMKPFADVKHVEEAFRLLSLSTLQAAEEDGASQCDVKIKEIVSQLRRRIPLRCTVAKSTVNLDLRTQGFHQDTIDRAIVKLIDCGQLIMCQKKNALQRKQ